MVLGIIDYIIFTIYMISIIIVGLYFFNKNKSSEDYYVGGRSIKAHHVGLSIAATDVGGGFSIGLGGLGFIMGLSGSWLLFTGLVGAWLSSVLIIPKIKKIDAKYKMTTYPDFLRLSYGKRVAFLAALISGVGYLGFASAQILAGAKLISVTILPTSVLGMDSLTFSIIIIAFITILYTAFGGLKAVIYTDTIQWILLMFGLLFVTIPFALHKIGGFAALRASLPAEYFSLTNIPFSTILNWMITIIPIWFIAMTLYQRMFACKDEKEAKKAWYIAGLFEYPVMAFAGVFLGMCAKVFIPAIDAELAVPMLIRDVLPTGIMGIVIASYFSAIMSTADSCLLASSGNFLSDIFELHIIKNNTFKKSVILSILTTLILGILAGVLAMYFKSVLGAILYAYSIMVSGLFIPTLGAYFWKKKSKYGAMAGMIFGGMTALLMETEILKLPEVLNNLHFPFTLYGIIVSLITFVSFSLLFPDKNQEINVN